MAVHIFHRPACLCFLLRNLPFTLARVFNFSEYFKFDHQSDREHGFIDVRDDFIEQNNTNEHCN